MSPVKDCPCPYNLKQMTLRWTHSQCTCISATVLGKSRKVGSNTAQMLRSNALEKQTKIKSVQRKNLMGGKWGTRAQSEQTKLDGLWLWAAVPDPEANASSWHSPPTYPPAPSPSKVSPSSCPLSHSVPTGKAFTAPSSNLLLLLLPLLLFLKNTSSFSWEKIIIIDHEVLDGDSYASLLFLLLPETGCAPHLYSATTNLLSKNTAHCTLPPTPQSPTLHPPTEPFLGPELPPQSQRGLSFVTTYLSHAFVSLPGCKWPQITQPGVLPGSFCP